MPTEHDLKTLPPFFEDVLAGRKRFELRRNDRDFAVGDTLRLREWSYSGEYTGRECCVRVTYGLGDGQGFSQFDLPPGYVVMSIEPVDATTPAVAGLGDVATIAWDAMVMTDGGPGYERRAAVAIAVAVRDHVEAKHAVEVAALRDGLQQAQDAVNEALRLARNGDGGDVDVAELSAALRCCSTLLRDPSPSVARIEAEVRLGRAALALDAWQQKNGALCIDPPEAKEYRAALAALRALKEGGAS